MGNVNKHNNKPYMCKRRGEKGIDAAKKHLSRLMTGTTSTANSRSLRTVFEQYQYQTRRCAKKHCGRVTVCLICMGVLVGSDGCQTTHNAERCNTSAD